MTVLAGNVHKVFWEANGVFENTQYSNRNMIFEHNPLVCIYIYRYKSVFQLDYIYLFLSKQLGDINIPWALAPGSREKKKGIIFQLFSPPFFPGLMLDDPQVVRRSDGRSKAWSDQGCLWGFFSPRPMERSICPVKVPRAPTRRNCLLRREFEGGWGVVVGFLLKGGKTHSCSKVVIF